MNSSYYKYCLVPQCKITTIKTLNKLFIYVPNNEQIRKKWLKLARRDDFVYQQIQECAFVQIISITCNLRSCTYPVSARRAGSYHVGVTTLGTDA
ncbi:hypothetical protein NQ317_003868 [Molorchus minor]|uniref:THAP-type domain-containing protein n=1 Tax=Molorchus minor TaxID=1323400 RepID=A0ABQ9JUI2_9CUCU|nr:hypothetical protein NQ317_003868 [Molorchus minor]